MATHLKAANNTGWAIGITIFALLWIAATVVAVVYYSKWDESRRGTIAANDKLQRYIVTGVGSNDEADLPIVKDMLGKQAQGGPSVIQQLITENGDLKFKLTGDRTMPYDAINSQLKAAGIEDQEVVLRVVEGLQNDVEGAEQAADTASASAATAQQRIQEVETEKNTLGTTFDTSVQQINTAVAAKGDELDTFRAQVEARFAQLDQQLAQAQANHVKEVTQLRGVIAQKDTEIQRLQTRIRQITTDLGPKAGGVEAWKLPDGSVKSLLPEENVVFIDRGRKDHILLGLTFEVFSRKTGIVADDIDNLRGKGTIEVIGVSENSAVCRVVRVERGQAVVEGDLIANVVYDPNFTFKFHVHGNFDLDGTGQPTVTDRRRVETMISQWGGDLTEELSYDVDFLVMGKEPELPRKPDDPLDPVANETYTKSLKEYEEYATLVAEARDLKIPILNQNRFLILIGYYQR